MEDRTATVSDMFATGNRPYARVCSHGDLLGDDLHSSTSVSDEEDCCVRLSDPGPMPIAVSLTSIRGTDVGRERNEDDSDANGIRTTPRGDTRALGAPPDVFGTQLAGGASAAARATDPAARGARGAGSASEFSHERSFSRDVREVSWAESEGTEGREEEKMCRLSIETSHPEELEYSSDKYLNSAGTNQGRRPGDLLPIAAFFGVYDGHDGDAVSTALCQDLHNLVAKQVCVCLLD